MHMDTSIEPPPAPRPFRWRSLPFFAVFTLLFGGIWLAVGLFISLIFTIVGGPFWNDMILDDRGVTAQATPTGVTMTSSRINGEYVREIRYTFSDERGAQHEGRTGTTDVLLVQRATAEMPITIEYVPESPALSRIKGERASFFGPFILIPVGFALVGAVVAGFGVLRTLRVRAIYVHGSAVRAEVISVEGTSMRMNRQPVKRVRYKFPGLRGEVVGTSTTVDDVKAGQAMWIICLPGEPEKNVAA